MGKQERRVAVVIGSSFVLFICLLAAAIDRDPKDLASLSAAPVFSDSEVEVLGPCLLALTQDQPIGAARFVQIQTSGCGLVTDAEFPTLAEQFFLSVIDPNETGQRLTFTDNNQTLVHYQARVENPQGQITYTGSCATTINREPTHRIKCLFVPTGQ